MIRQAWSGLTLASNSSRATTRCLTSDLTAGACAVALLVSCGLALGAPPAWAARGRSSSISNMLDDDSSLRAASGAGASCINRNVLPRTRAQGDDLFLNNLHLRQRCPVRGISFRACFSDSPQVQQCRVQAEQL